MPKNRLGPKMNTVRQKVTSECNKLRHEHTIRTSEKDQTRTYLSHARLHLCPSRKKNKSRIFENCSHGKQAVHGNRTMVFMFCDLRGNFGVLPRDKLPFGSMIVIFK